MYANLKAEMAKKSITRRQIARTLSLHENTVKNKIAGKSHFSIEESFLLKKTYFPDLTLKYLFAIS